MPRSDRKPTLRERADAYAARVGGKNSDINDSVALGYLAGHRANRLTKAERDVVEAAMAIDASGLPHSELYKAQAALRTERARKGGK